MPPVPYTNGQPLEVNHFQNLIDDGHVYTTEDLQREILKISNKACPVGQSVIVDIAAALTQNGRRPTLQELIDRIEELEDETKVMLINERDEKIRLQFENNELRQEKRLLSQRLDEQARKLSRAEEEKRLLSQHSDEQARKLSRAEEENRRLLQLLQQVEKGKRQLYARME